MSGHLRGRLPAVEHPGFRPAAGRIIGAADPAMLRPLLACLELLDSSLHPDDRTAVSALVSVRLREQGMRTEPSALDATVARVVTAHDWSPAAVQADRALLAAAGRTGQMAEVARMLADLREVIEQLRAWPLRP